MEIAVVGATGFVGSNLCRILGKTGFSITPFNRLATEKLLRNGIDPELRFDWVVNCTGGTQDLQTVNTRLPMQLYQQINPHLDGGFLQVSSVAAGQSTTPEGIPINETDPAVPETAYGRSKSEGENALNAVKKSSIKLCILRPPILYGADAKGVFNLLKRSSRLGLPLPLASLSNLRHFMFVENFAYAVASAIRSELDGTYYVVDHPPKTVSQFYNAMCSASGKGKRSFALGPLTRPVISALLGSRATSLIENSCYDDTKFRQATGFQPPKDFNSAIANSICASDC
ncbi:NAD-dependent epimerase/dehydratase family protein [Parasphingorhabdus litoris]|uniref:NAD-dependent epimerase/dehydratase family protein n=1 Tax=Parasphingorhabdus litoris TaxID=394733 RepID=A0ABN1AFK5_9SPHN|nr:NAD-dependent epimerase/dehydratase family protein [Parasphingorhabdus litoris]